MNKVVTANELLEMYKNLLKEHKELKNINELLNSKVEALEDCMNAKDELISSQERIIQKQEELIENLQNMPYQNTCGVEKTGDLNDYEYMSDGKRMCFQNYQTGNRVYAGDELFSVLKNRMLRGDTYES